MGPGSSEAHRVDLEFPEWQVIEIPLVDVMSTTYGDTITSFGLFGNLEGTFYLDDVRLVAPERVMTAVSEMSFPATPLASALYQSYPNPFNGTVAIPFDLHVTSPVELAVYNLTGQKVATLANGSREAGAYTLRWDGRDDDERELASGVYPIACRLDLR